MYLVHQIFSWAMVDFFNRVEHLLALRRERGELGFDLFDYGAEYVVYGVLCGGDVASLGDV